MTEAAEPASAEPFTSPPAGDHQADVERGLAGEHITDEDATTLAVNRFAQAASEEWAFMRAPINQWETAMRGVLTKARASVTSGEDGVVIITLP